MSMVALWRGPGGTIGGCGSVVVVVDDEAVVAVAVVGRSGETNPVVVVASAGGSGSASEVQALASKLVNSNALISRDRMAAR